MRLKSISKFGSSRLLRQKNPRVGVFWLYKRKLLIDSTPLNKAEPYGYHLTHLRNHLEVWTWFQQRGTVPADIEYEELPRGRVVYNIQTGQFTLLADKCILTDKKTLARVIMEMKLPKDMTVEKDDHYRCGFA